MEGGGTHLEWPLKMAAVPGQCGNATGKLEEEESGKSGREDVGDSEVRGQHPSKVIIRKGGRGGRPGRS